MVELVAIEENIKYCRKIKKRKVDQWSNQRGLSEGEKILVHINPSVVPLFKPPVLLSVVAWGVEMLKHRDELEHQTFQDHTEYVALDEELGYNQQDDLEEEDRHETLDDGPLPSLGGGGPGAPKMEKSLP